MAKHIVYAPNVVCICADKLTETSCSGRLYTRYGSTSESFDDISALLLKIDRFFDKINYPEASTRSRSFNEDKTGSMQPRKINLEASVSGDEFLKNKGKIATFFVRVQSRQNSTWQGVFWWAEKDTETEFVSALDVLKLIDRAVTQ